jgi:hypothetical protein
MHTSWRQSCKLLGLLAALSLPAGDGFAQLDPTSALRNSAHAKRELRAVQGRSLSQPGQAARDAVNARQQLLRSGQGVNLDPSQRRVERGLADLSQAPPARDGPIPPQRLPSADLPASYDNDLLLPRRSSTALAETLLDRAANGLAVGRSDQARSDLGLAEQQLQGVPPDQLDDPATKSVIQRAAELRRQLP